MISSLQGTGAAAAAQDKGSAEVSVSLSPQLYQLLQDAMKEAGIDPNQLHTPPQDASSEAAAVANFRKLFGGVSYPVELAETATAPAAPPFTPKFNSAKGFDSSTGAVYKMNDTYFADRETAEWIAGKYGTGEIRENNMLGQGPFGVDTKMFEVELEDGRWVNAGMLAGYYDRNPASLYPGLADKLIQDVLKQDALKNA